MYGPWTKGLKVEASAAYTFVSMEERPEMRNCLCKANSFHLTHLVHF